MICIFLIAILLVLGCNISQAKLKTIGLENDNCENEEKDSDIFLSYNRIKEFEDFINTNVAITNNGLPDLVFGEVCCYFNSEPSSGSPCIEVLGTIVNIGDTFILDKDQDFHVKLKIDGVQCGLIKLPGIVRIKRWQNNGNGISFSAKIYGYSESVTLELDCYNDICEKNEDNNIKKYDVGPGIIISGHVYNEEGQPLENAIFTYYAIENYYLKIGPCKFTDENGYYKRVIPAKKPFDILHKYDLFMDLSPDYDKQNKITDEIAAGSSFTVDFHLKESDKSKIFSFFDFVNNFINRFLGLYQNFYCI